MIAVDEDDVVGGRLDGIGSRVRDLERDTVAQVVALERAREQLVRARHGRIDVERENATARESEEKCRPAAVAADLDDGRRRERTKQAIEISGLVDH